ncbi:MAG TPA: aminotransferase class I/II-fold pyridoxal phosphate-dependent enzyme [Candidatus Enterosoma merdigallinarum]|mgnify:CR=1 FL=1|nr:aminotransferase class I/II-fold pyridoxal phosphate-dependent enzyme [Candidatus Enterosoma merdigallinarum]
MVDLRYDILSIQERAVKRKAEGHDVINGCAGMLFEDDKTLCIYEDVNAKIEKSFRHYLAYPSVLGSDDYREGVLSWLFRSDKEKIERRFQVPFGVSLGGTGAISMAFSHYSRKNAIVLLPDIRWPNYDTIADQCQIPFALHRLLDEKGGLDIPSIRQALETCLESHDTVLLVLNDPCQNPLGYCLSREEYERLFDLLSEFGRKVVLLLDLAYVDYCPEGFLFKETLLSRKEIPFDCLVCFSASKSFGLYGLRLGALFGLMRKEEDIQPLLSDMKRIARGTYSCANNGAMGPLAEFFSDKDAMEKVEGKIHAESQRLNTIGKAVSALLDDLGIKHFPYKGGFYLTFSMANPIEFCKKLEEKDIFFAPIDDSHIRIAVSGLNEKEVAELGRRLSR